ncbi:MAG TPA: HAMP domain-containing protein, partial [Gemmataceae bacterium]|nr:HAMP domain-containing protein [Gemmataceae bacterium]
MAGSLLVLITVAGGAWSVVMFARLSTVVGETLRETQRTIDLTARLADALEREDDALLLVLTGKLRNARSELAQQRQDFDEAYARLLPRLSDPEEQEAGRALRAHADAYHAAGDKLLTSAGKPGTLRESQETIDLTARLADTLEREDDALLLALSGKPKGAQAEVARQRRDFDEAYARLLPGLSDAEEQAAAKALHTHVDGYRRSGDVLLKDATQANARELYHAQVNPALRKAVADCGRIRELTFRGIQNVGRARDFYHEEVNPALRKAVADCARIRELNFNTMQQIGVDASIETRRSTLIVAGIALVALGLSTLVMVLLAQRIVRPVRELTRSVDAIRRDDFKTRVHVDTNDELGELAQGFNRMAETLGEYRESSLGELLLAKSTLEATMAALPDAVIVVDPDGLIVAKNPLAEKILKAIGDRKTERFEDLPLATGILKDVRETLRTGHAGAVRPDLNQALPVTVDGRPLKMLASVVPIPQYLPRRAGAAIVLADVTDFARLD